MARTKGARGKKNIPTNRLFINSLKQLSDKYLKRLDEIANNPEAPDSIIVKAAALVIGETMVVLRHEKYGASESENNDSKTVEEKNQNTLAPIIDFSFASKNK